MKTWILAAFVAASLAAPTLAAEPDPAEFLHEAMGGGMAQMLYGRIAVQRAERTEVVAFAEEILREQSAANRQLIALAQTAGLAPAPVSAGDAERDLEALRLTPPHSFDLAWLTVVAEEHRRLAALYDGYAGDGADPALRAHVEAALPAIRARLAEAEALAERTEMAETR